MVKKCMKLLDEVMLHEPSEMFDQPPKSVIIEVGIVDPRKEDLLLRILKQLIYIRKKNYFL